MKKRRATQPRGLMVAGLSGGSGKSVVAVGLAAALARRGYGVAPFKKGPDYIDAGWLQLVSGRDCHNLDPYLMSPEVIRHSFSTHAARAEIAVIEGNRGLFDGVNPEGGFSTAELAKQLGLPVLLVLDCTKTTRTVAAMVLGCRVLDPMVDIRGVVLNRVGTGRQENLIRQAVERYASVPVLGAVPRLGRDVFPQRHLGVTPHQEYDNAEDVGRELGDIVEQYCDVNGIVEVMAPVGVVEDKSIKTVAAIADQPVVRLGVLQDAAFQFYYPDNLQALIDAGAELVGLNALRDTEIPEIDGLYIGGGFPETSARELAANIPFRRAIRARADAGLPIYAECGGLIYLGQSIVLDNEEFELAGVLPVKFGMAKRPQAHGYTNLRVDGVNPFYPAGLAIRGHEFRYSTVLEWAGKPGDLVFEVTRGSGFQGGRDGLVYCNVLALYTHVHALATPEWASGLVRRAREYKGS